MLAHPPAITFESSDQNQFLYSSIFYGSTRPPSALSDFLVFCITSCNTRFHPNPTSSQSSLSPQTVHLASLRWIAVWKRCLLYRVGSYSSIVTPADFQDSSCTPFGLERTEHNHQGDHGSRTPYFATVLGSSAESCRDANIETFRLQDHLHDNGILGEEHVGEADQLVGDSTRVPPPTNECRVEGCHHSPTSNLWEEMEENNASSNERCHEYPSETEDTSLPIPRPLTNRWWGRQAAGHRRVQRAEPSYVYRFGQRYCEAENNLLRELVLQELPWPEVHQKFNKEYPGRSLKSLRVYWSTKLKFEGSAGLTRSRRRRLR